jgi:hypothetical protein
MPGMKSRDPHPKDKLSTGGIRGKDKKEIGHRKSQTIAEQISPSQSS